MPIPDTVRAGLNMWVIITSVIGTHVCTTQLENLPEGYELYPFFPALYLLIYMVGFATTRLATASGPRAGETVGSKARKMGMTEIEVRIKGAGAGRESAVTGLVSSGLRVTAIEDHTPVPHNGCRPPKRRRV